MQVKYFMPLWGNGHLSLADFLSNVKEAGYDGVEMNISLDIIHVDEIQSLLVEHGLLLIAQQWLPPQNETADQYIIRMEKYLRHLAAFRPLFINSHTGKDFYSFEDNCKILETADNISKDTGVNIYHETHRGRCLYSAPASKEYFRKYPELKITADFSHWCCVSESFLDGQDDLVNEAVSRAFHVHARVGSDQRPQVTHPFAPENKIALEKHMEWWKNIYISHCKRETRMLTITTEFGPIPYMPTLPFTDQPVSDMWKINVDMLNYLRVRLETK